MTLFTFGLWWVVWLLIGILSSSAAKCSHCGTSYNQRLAVETKAKLQGARQHASALPPAPIGGGMKRCPFCAEEVRAEAAKCKHCGSALEPQMR
jgi:hypothetical protein